ncbi:DUF4554 domain-containing protein isoform X2 [Anguilla anguilla]|uniref:DUF4554 domain-containing protein isoform X2 n=1 Tax=Anguilla anguilla TaxID=7936 RepID=UPI0015ADEEA0|nr:DUF4554 domain-containing protein isoform X2 [Anguilla anguilla]
MQRDIQQVIRFLMTEVRRARRQGSGNMEGGLLVAVSAEDGVSSTGKFNCTVAAAGRWCIAVSVEEIKHEVVKRLPSSMALSSPVHPEELSIFSETCGPLRFLFSVQVGEGRQAVNSDFLKTEQFLHRLSLVYGQVEIHFILKVNETVSRQVFSGRADSKFVLESRHILTKTDLYIRCPLSAGPGLQCGRLHPVPGGAVPLLLPPEVAETGLCGETSLLPLAALGPCVEQYPYRPACVTQIRILLYGPSNVPLLWDGDGGPSGFLGRLGGLLSWGELGLSGVSRAERPFTEGALHAEVVYTVDSEQSPTTEQTLILFLFIQHSDPFHSQLSDHIASEEVLEQHLDQILLHNEDRVRSALHSVLESALRTTLKRLKARAKIMSALPVILSSLSTVVTSSSSLEFRTACLDRMKVQDTHELAIRLRQSLQKVTEGRVLHSRKCDSGKCLSAASGVEDVSGHREAETRGTGEQEWACAEHSHHDEGAEAAPVGSQGSAGQGSGAEKRQCTEEPDSNPPPLKQRGTRGASGDLRPSESLHSPPAHAAPPQDKGDQQEDMLWLQEVSNMSDWEEEC